MTATKRYEQLTGRKAPTTTHRIERTFADEVAFEARLWAAHTEGLAALNR